MKKSIFAAAGAVFISLGAAVFFSGCASSPEAEEKGLNITEFEDIYPAGLQ